jgi:hypothetical protein
VCLAAARAATTFIYPLYDVGVINLSSAIKEGIVKRMKRPDEVICRYKLKLHAHAKELNGIIFFA